MKKIIWGFVVLALLPLQCAYAQCTLKEFRWECDLPVHVKKHKHPPSSFTCGPAHGFISERDYLRLVEYQRANINMVLDIDHEYIDSPCIPEHRKY